MRPRTKRRISGGASRDQMNRVYIEPTKFTNLRGGEEYFGWRAYDDYAQAYDNTWEKADISDDDVAFLKRVLKMNDDETLWSMLDFCAEHERGVYVGDTFVDWPELLLLLETVRTK